MSTCATIKEGIYFFTGPEPSTQSDLLEQPLRTFYTITLGPLQSCLTHFFPSLGSWSYNYGEILEKGNAGQELSLPDKTVKYLFEQVRALKEHAGLTRDIRIVKGTSYSPHSFGGTWSIGSPILALPEFLLRRADGSNFGDAERPDKKFFSNEETKFLIAREIGYITHNHSIVRTLLKVVLFASGIFAFFGPIGTLIKFLIAGAALAGILAEEHFFQWRMDRVGVEILAKSYPDQSIERAAKVAIRTLNKIRLRNKASRDSNQKLGWYISRRGDNWLDISAPPLTKRIQSLKQLLQTPSKSE